MKTKTRIAEIDRGTLYIGGLAWWFLLPRLIAIAGFLLAAVWVVLTLVAVHQDPNATEAPAWYAWFSLYTVALYLLGGIGWAIHAVVRSLR